MGDRPEKLRGVWDTMPGCPGPSDSIDPERQFDDPSLDDHVDVKMAPGMLGFSGAGEPTGDNRSLIWVRVPDVRFDAAALSIIADYAPSVVGNAMGRLTNSSGLDSTIRYADPASDDTDRVLCDNQVEFVVNGFANSSCLIRSRGGSTARDGQPVDDDRCSLTYRVPASTGKRSGSDTGGASTVAA